MKVPLLLLPGLLCDQRLFSWLTLPADWQLHSSALPVRDRFESIAQQLLRHAPPRFLLGGLSLGGLLAFEVFRQAPERVLGMVILNSNFAAERPQVSEARNALVARAQAGEFSRITAELLLPKMVFPANNTTKLAELVVRMADDVGLESLCAHARALETRPDARELLSQIRRPTLVICGRNDALCPVSNHLQMAEAIPQCSLHILDRCGHLSPLERPATVSTHLAHWWELNGAAVRKEAAHC